MPEFLDLNRLPEYSHSSFRYFEKHEKHITRIKFISKDHTCRKGESHE